MEHLEDITYPRVIEAVSRVLLCICTDWAEQGNPHQTYGWLTNLYGDSYDALDEAGRTALFSLTAGFAESTGLIADGSVYPAKDLIPSNVLPYGPKESAARQEKRDLQIARAEEDRRRAETERRRDFDRSMYEYHRNKLGGW